MQVNQVLAATLFPSEQHTVPLLKNPTHRQRSAVQKQGFKPSGMMT